MHLLITSRKCVVQNVKTVEFEMVRFLKCDPFGMHSFCKNCNIMKSHEKYCKYKAENIKQVINFKISAFCHVNFISRELL